MQLLSLLGGTAGSFPKHGAGGKRTPVLFEGAGPAGKIRRQDLQSGPWADCKAVAVASGA